MKKLFRILTGLSLNLSLFILSYIISRKKGLILLGGGLGKKFNGNSKYFYLYLIRKHSERKLYPCISFYWITESYKLYQELKEKNMPVLYKYSIRGFWQILRAEYIVIESGTAIGEGGHDIGYERLFFGKFNIVQTWHGIPIKRICLDALEDRGLNNVLEIVYYYLHKKELSLYCCVPAQSKYDQQVLTKAFANPNARILGSARNDIFFDHQYSYKNYQQKFALDKYKKVILYAPTFRDRENSVKPFTEDDLDELNRFFVDQNYVFLVKKHAFDKNLVIPSDLLRIIDVSDKVDDIQEVLIHSDILITDYSSVCFDFALTGRPIIYYPYDFGDYLQSSRKLYIDYFTDMPGPFAKNARELLDLIVNWNIWFEDHNYQVIRSNIRNLYRGSKHTKMVILVIGFIVQS